MVTVAQAYISKKRELSCKYLILSSLDLFKTTFISKFDSKRTCATGTTYNRNCGFVACGNNCVSINVWNFSYLSF